MGLAVRAAGLFSRVLARLHRWYGAAWLLGHLPLATLDDTSTGRLRYALMMANKTQPARTRQLFERMLQSNSNLPARLLIELAAMATVTAQPAEAARLLLAATEDAAPGSHMADVAQKLLRVNMGIADGSLQTYLAAAITALALPVAAPVTLVPVSGKYLELWELWLGQVRKHVGRHVVAMAMDDAALAALLAEEDVSVIDVRQFFSWNEKGHLHPHTRGVLWYLRVLLLHSLVQKGHAVLVLDLDALPVGDLAPLLQEMRTADVVAQEDHSIPMDVDRQLGFVLCCGFMFWRPSPAAEALLRHYVLATAIERDDQLALNHLLTQEGIEPEEGPHDRRFGSGDVCFMRPDPSLVSRSLHSGAIIRHFHQQGQSVEEIRSTLNL